MRLVFFGTPEFAVPSLRALHSAGHHIAGVVTQPDRARGRHHSQLLPPPVKQLALDAGLDIVQPARPRDQEFESWLHGRHADLGIVVAYGHILRPEILRIPRLGMVNVHASLLPRWRGAAPVPWAIHAGDRETGISIMQMEEGLDSGPVFLQRPMPIGESDTAGALATRLADLGAQSLLAALPAIAAGQTPKQQDEADVTHARKLTRELARIDWTQDANAVARHIRAFDPVPGAWTMLGGIEVKLFGGGPAATPDETPRDQTGLAIPHGDGLLVSARHGAVHITEIQPAGRKRMSARDWLNGGGLRQGEHFE